MNKLTDIDFEVFNDLAKLNEILLRSNLLKSVSDCKQSLASLKMLNNIQLSHNKLTAIDLNIFKNMSNLKFINLNNNDHTLIIDRTGLTFQVYS